MAYWKTAKQDENKTKKGMRKSEKKNVKMHPSLIKFYGLFFYNKNSRTHLSKSSSFMAASKAGGNVMTYLNKVSARTICFSRCWKRIEVATK